MIPPQTLCVAGLGCRRHCSADDLLAVLQQALDCQGLPLSALVGLATGAHKQHEQGLQQLAADLKQPLYYCAPEQLAAQEARLTRRSSLSQQYSGSSGLAEASALALAEQLSAQPSRLLGPRHNNAQATCALAVIVPLEPQ